MVKPCTLCYHCGIESTQNLFKYYENGKRTQPRYQCRNCEKFFTMGSQCRPQGRTNTKQRNVDPPRLKGLSRECRCCGVADNASFKYYNNSNLSQPRFECLSCGQQFQMRLRGSGQKRRLVHTSSYQRPPPSDCPKLGLAPNSSSFDDISGQMQAPVDPWMAPNSSHDNISEQMQAPVDPRTPNSYGDDISAQIEAPVDPWMAYDDDISGPIQAPVDPWMAPNSYDDDTCEQMQARVDAWISAFEVGVELFPTLSFEEAKYLDLIEAGLNNEREAPSPSAFMAY